MSKSVSKETMPSSSDIKIDWEVIFIMLLRFMITKLAAAVLEIYVYVVHKVCLTDEMMLDLLVTV